MMLIVPRHQRDLFRKLIDFKKALWIEHRVDVSDMFSQVPTWRRRGWYQSQRHRTQPPA